MDKDIQKATDEAISRGLASSNIKWRNETLKNLYLFCEYTETFTMNEFREFNSIMTNLKTHDNRAMGGIIATARKEMWIEPTGESIISKVGHKSPLQIWRSKIFNHD